MITKVGMPYYSEYETAKPGLESIKDDSRFDFSFVRNSMVSCARNSCMQVNPRSSLKKQKVIDRNFLSLDSDIAFTKEDVERILELGKSHPIVHFPYKTQDDLSLYQCGDFGLVPGVVSSRAPVQSKFPTLVDWCGMGFTFIRKEVFEEIEYPYFRFTVLEIGDNASQTSEDIGFCMQVYGKFPIYCDFSNPVKHKIRSTGNVE